MFVRVSLLAAFGLACLSGCDSGPKLVPVQGTVTLDGKPLIFKSLYFHPDRDSGTKGNGAGGYTDKDGKYYLIANIGGATRDHRGIQAGKYRVTVSEPVIPISEKDFGPQKQQSETDIPSPAVVFSAQPAKREVPVAYATVGSTPLMLEVLEDGGDLNIELKSKP